MTTHAADDPRVDGAGTRPSLRPPANRVSPRAPWYWFTSALAGWVLVLAVEVAALVLDWPFPPGKVPVLVVTVAVAAVHVTVMPWLRRRVHRWELTGTAVYTRTGWWTQESRIAPLSRVQTVDSARGPLARLFGLTEVTVTTASAAGPLRIQALDEATAAGLAADITRASEQFREDAT